MFFSCRKRIAGPGAGPLTRAEMTRRGGGGGTNLCHTSPVSPPVARSSAQTWPPARRYATKLAKRSRTSTHIATERENGNNGEAAEELQVIQPDPPPPRGQVPSPHKETGLQELPEPFFFFVLRDGEDETFMAQQERAEERSNHDDGFIRL